MSKNKSEIVKWEYVTNPFDVLVLPETVKRVHSPLEPSLTPWPQFPHQLCLHLRPCVQGVDEYGAVVKYLYCTRAGRFFTRGKDGWNEVLPNEVHGRSKKRNPKSGGGFDAPFMVNFGYKSCHRCVAFAWCNPPENATKLEVDHLNCDHANWTADNLQWVTPAENRRRGKIAKRMRKIGINPKLLTPTLCSGIYSLPHDRIDEFIERFQIVCNECTKPMDIYHIQACVSVALDIIKSTTTNNNKQQH